MYTLSDGLTRGGRKGTVAVMVEREPISVVVTSVGTEQQAVEISEELVLRRLATCVNILPCLRSLYRWKGQICNDSEYLLLIKTRRSLFEAVSEAIRDLHSYELPEVLEFAVSSAEPSFHQWVVDMATGVPDEDPAMAPESEPAYD